MKPAGSARKGKRWAREAARLLGEWYYGDPDALYPTPGSGTRRAAEHHGDIGPAKSGLAPPWVFCVEAKHGDRGGTRWSLDDLLLGTDKAPLVRYWRQCAAAAKAARRVPLLLLKRNREAPLACLASGDICSYQVTPLLVVKARRFDLRLVVMPLSVLLRVTKPADWVKWWCESVPVVGPGARGENA